MDRISDLPLSIIETILCRLPYHEVVRTSTLSKEWKYHWTKIAKIMVVANRQTLNRSKLLCGVGQALLMHKGPIHEVILYVYAGDWSYEREIDHIISHLSSKKTVKKLAIDFVYSSEYRLHSLPISLFSMSQLTDLYLNYCDLNHESRISSLKRRRNSQTSWLPSGGLGSLTSLYVLKSKISMKTLLHILSNCPLLNTMTLKAHEFYDSDGITVTNLFESLKVIKNLTIWREIIEDLVVNTTDRSIPQQVPVTLVHLKSLFIEDISLDVDGLQIISLFIRSSPNLEKLTVNIMNDSSDEEVPCSRSLEVYSDIRLEHLRELEIIHLSSTMIELYILKFILMRSPVLKMLRIHIDESYKDDEMHISETLLSAPRASPVVELIVENEPPLTALSYGTLNWSKTSLTQVLKLANSDSIVY